LLKRGYKKIGIVGRAGISSKFYKCGHFGGKGDKALPLAMIIEVFHCEYLMRKGTAVKLLKLQAI
jgi:hypothetical protein